MGACIRLQGNLVALLAVVNCQNELSKFYLVKKQIFDLRICILKKTVLRKENGLLCCFWCQKNCYMLRFSLH